MPNSQTLARHALPPTTDRDWSLITQSLSTQFEKTKELLTEAGISLESLKALSVAAAKANEPYGRNVLYRSDLFEVMLATWSKGAECAAHDHGFSKGVVWLVEGDFSETHYELGKSLVVLGKPIYRPAGTLLRVTPGDIHSMVAKDGGISLHIYTPAIQTMKVFDVQKSRTLTVTDDCGAWVPVNSQQILAEEAWA
jgi:predicted metal-dependent enzyme (double-stranded beta helix superfamily)